MKTVFLVPQGERGHAAFRVDAHVAAGRALGRDVSALTVPAAPLARFVFFRRLGRADVIVIHRELPSESELRILRRLASRIVYDVADAAWTLPQSRLDGMMARRSVGRSARSFARVCAEADLCLVENMAQAKAAARFQERVSILPTPLDTDVYTPGSALDGDVPGCGPVRVGWMVSGGDRQCLAEIVGGLSGRGGCIQFFIVSDEPYEGPGKDFVFWSRPEPGREVAALQDMEIGLAPYPDDEYSQAGSGLDALRYMACGAVVVASDRGGAVDLVDHGIDGFLVRDTEDWARHVLRLAEDAALRRDMARAARDKVVGKYGLETVSAQLWDALESLR
ncbi:glycosyltransferase [Pseudodesulfovibrio sp. F-1]|uniref:Glycosyltransferase n=1 Tax=Pseudodesulfovibrio alkaliphilus TaxID=2661613 RepID=A0A7K1KLQ9_9BACT|nr:glycosyltransferase family 4 protein [Pseudodesulfovibrio alkaliphilus]MUM76891.1 glycosyltransferase [Pseudodesulfovibrio alkaliphilus]